MARSCSRRADRSFATFTKPTMPFRRRFWSWPAAPARFATRRPSRAGCTESPLASPCGRERKRRVGAPWLAISPNATDRTIGRRSSRIAMKCPRSLKRSPGSPSVPCADRALLPRVPVARQAARILHCKVTTLQTRLLRAKAKLRVRLARRGLAPAVGFLAGGAASTEAASVVSGALPDALAGSTARAAARYAAASSAEIKTTILAMAQQALTALLWNRLSHTVRLTACLVAGMVLTGIVMLLTTAKKPDEAVKAITGRVLDARGGPIAGAQVWLQANFDDTDRSTARATTDAQGRYTLVLPDVWFQTPPHQRSSVVWAYAADHQIATANSYKALLSAEPEPVDLTLGPATDTTFVVMGPDGRPLAGAVVEPYHFKTPRAYEFPPRTMLPLMRAITDDAGRARLPALPREGLRAIQVTSEALGARG